jgi:hypothetical protein|tara:strand:+ start:2713 stop:2898 length:186 start_codon:yes stop_codon:yes gene_type:complete
MNSYKEEIEIFLKTLKATITVFELIKESNKNEKEQIEYLINVSEELHKFTKEIIPNLKRLR